MNKANASKPELSGHAIARNPLVPEERDPLTGLCSRSSLHRVLSETMVTARPGGTLPALLALDLDRFQAVNDSTGIATGDGVLSRVAQRIQGAVPKNATVARISGDEFAVLLPDGDQSNEVAAKLLDLIARPYAVKGHAVTLSVSIGVARRAAVMRTPTGCCRPRTSHCTVPRLMEKTAGACSNPGCRSAPAYARHSRWTCVQRLR